MDARRDAASGSHAPSFSPRRPADLAAVLAAIALVPAYAGGAGLWDWLTLEFGRRAAFVPVAVMALLLALLGSLALRRRGGPAALHPWALLAGAGVAVAALALPEAAFPAKRIHVAEYLVLALLLRRGLSGRVQGTALAVLAVLAAAVLGAHDELLQGLLPPRTFGLRDVLVDVFGALSGGLLGHGLRLFEDGADKPHVEPAPASRALAALWPGGALTLFGLILLLVTLPAFRHDALPYWSVLPLLAGGLAYFLVPPKPTTAPGLAEGVMLVAGLALATAAYPALIWAMGWRIN